MIKFTIKDFNTKYPTEEVCIQEIFDKKYGYLKKCPVCKKPFKYFKLHDRKCYSCQYCANQIHPLANTIFHKSDTSIRLWFYAIFLFSASRNGVSAMELQRQLGVTYKCAWRIANKVRTLFKDNNKILQNIVEIDETYVGGKGENNKRGRGSENKIPVLGMVERKGEIEAKVTVDTKRKTYRFWAFEGVIRDKRIKAIVRQIGKGKKHFWSVIPTWKKSRFGRRNTKSNLGRI